MISVQEAHRMIKKSIPDPEVETVPSTRVIGRVLAEEVRATFPQPRFDNSTMDGFAVRHEDTDKASKKKPATLKSKGVISVDSFPGICVEPGECVQVMTGIPIPPGADAVVMVEDTSGFKSDGTVQIFKPVGTGENVRFQGEEIQSGEPVFLAGNRIGPSEIGILTTFGYLNIKVYRQPRMTIFATGDELKDIGEPLRDGEIFNSNLPVLKDLADRVGAIVILKERIRDKPSSLKRFLKTAIESSDIVVSTGGISMGRYDYVREILLDLGVIERFWRVAQKPGKPLFFGSLGKKLFFGLPGNPVSAFICFMEYIWPTCERWMGLHPKSKFKVLLEEPFPRDPRKHRFLFGHVWIKNGDLRCVPTSRQGSHMLSSAVGANSILETDPGVEPLHEGETVVASILPWESIRSEP